MLRHLLITYRKIPTNRYDRGTAERLFPYLFWIGVGAGSPYFRCDLESEQQL